MAEPGVESPQPRQYRRHESMKEYRRVKANEKQQKLEKSTEREHKRQAALKAISKDKPNVPERIDLENLAGVNNQPESAAPAQSETQLPHSPTSENKTNPERKLLNAEMTGTQAVLLLGGTTPETIDKAKIEAIAKGEPVQTEKINKVSQSERDEYWNGENSPYKDKTRGERHEIWLNGMNSFLGQYRGKSEEQFFTRMGIDLQNPNAAQEIYDVYFVNGKGDVGLFASTIAAKNTAQEINANMKVLQKLGNMYGKNSAKVAEQLVAGIKNAQTDTDLFIQSAQNELQKGTTMGGIDLVNILDRSPAKNQQSQEVNESVMESVVPEISSSPTDEVSDNDAEKNKTSSERTFRERYIAAGSKRHYKKDQWKSDSGEISVNDNHISFVPSGEINRRYEVEEYDQDYDGPVKPLRYYDVFADEAKGPERGIQLTVEVTDETFDPKITEQTGLKRVPTPFMWELLEVDPESLGKRGYTFDTEAYSSDPLKAKKYTRADPSFYGIGGRDSELVGETTLGLSWGKVTVDKGTLVAMQQRAIEYLGQQVQDGQLPQEMLDTAKGILETHKARNTVDEKWQTNRGSGTSAEDPKMHSTFLQLTETWKTTGAVKQEGDLLVYDDEKSRKKDERREVELATVDQESGRKVLTEQSWDILKLVPETAAVGPYQLNVTEATSNAIQDRKGTWKKFIKPFSTDSQTLSQMQQMIRSYAAQQVSLGQMDAATLSTIDGLIKYKHSTLEPIRYDGQGKVTYEMKGKKRPAYVEIKREPTLVEKVAEAANSSESVSNVDVTDSDIRKYLGEKRLPAGAQIKNLAIEFRGNTATMVGIVDVPIPFVGGKINFNLELANNPDGSGLMVTRHHVDTKSGTLRSKLGDLEANLSNINSFISEDINEQLRYRNPSLRVLGLSISPDGKFSARVQNSQQAAA